MSKLQFQENEWTKYCKFKIIKWAKFGSKSKTSGLVPKTAECFRQLFLDFPTGAVWECPQAGKLLQGKQWETNGQTKEGTGNDQFSNSTKTGSQFSLFFF